MEINLKKGKLIPVSFMQPHPGGSSLLCSRCTSLDFTVHSLTTSMRCVRCQGDAHAVHVDQIGKDSASVNEVICVGCRKQTKLDLSGSIDDKPITGLKCCGCQKQTILEDGAVIDRRGEFLEQQSKRIIHDG